MESKTAMVVARAYLAVAGALLGVSHTLVEKHVPRTEQNGVKEFAFIFLN